MPLGEFGPVRSSGYRSRAHDVPVVAPAARRGGAGRAIGGVSGRVLSRQTRRMGGQPAGSSSLRVRFGEFELDEANARLLRGGSAIPLSPTPFGLLCALAAPSRLAADEARPARRGLGPPLRERLGVEGHDQRHPNGSRRRSAEPTLHRNGVAPRLSVHCESVALQESPFGATCRRGPDKTGTRRFADGAHRRRVASAAGELFDRPRHGARAPSQRLGAREQRSSRDRLGCGRARNRQDHAHRALCRGSRRSRLRARTVRAAVRVGRAVPSRARSAWRALPQEPRTFRLCYARSRRPGCCSCRGSALRRSAKHCARSSSAQPPSACSGRWANSSIATPRIGRCC